MPPLTPVEAGDYTEQWRLTNVASFWLPITVDNLSGQAYGLGLKSKFAFDFKVIPTALDITCTGSKEACERFGQAIATFIAYINTQPANP